VMTIMDSSVGCHSRLVMGRWWHVNRARGWGVDDLSLD